MTQTRQDVHFCRNANGFLSAEIDGVSYDRVQLTRALPLTQPGAYIQIADMEGKELAIIEDLSALERAERALAEEELALRYFYPEVTKVHSMKEKLGSYYCKLQCGKVEKTIAIRDVSKNIKQLSGGRIMITDTEGNRFLIPDTKRIEKRSMRMIEPFLY
ncbi:MAG: DUF1854 domain-containing protein [Oscillospiraceae bacterium]|jgi:hypothetical protein|nr:DUF1854 domain-containing protein [Oscillospiraceae bacterium]